MGCWPLTTARNNVDDEAGGDGERCADEGERTPPVMVNLADAALQIVDDIAQNEHGEDNQCRPD